MEIYFYSRNLSDYSVRTSHLNLLEHGALTLLTDRYFSSQAPIPGAIVYSVCHARTKAEKSAVDNVLLQFFELESEGWRSVKLDEEISKIQARSEISRENGKKGGRKKAGAEDMENPQQNQGDVKPGGLASGSLEESDGEAIQKQIPNIYKSESKNTTTSNSVVVFFEGFEPDLREIVKDRVSHLPLPRQADIVDELLGRLRENKVEKFEGLLSCLVACVENGKHLRTDFARKERDRRNKIRDQGTPEERAEHVKARAAAERTEQTVKSGMELLKKFGASSLAQKAELSIH